MSEPGPFIHHALDVGAHQAHHVPALQTCFRSADHAQGVASFLERHPADFTGR